jgi:hypothetical protein
MLSVTLILGCSRELPPGSGELDDKGGTGTGSKTTSEGKPKDGLNKTPTKQPDFSMAAEVFAKDVKMDIDNLDRANKKYIGKVIELTGEVASVDEGIDSGGAFGAVQVTLKYRTRAVKNEDDGNTAIGCVLSAPYETRGLFLSPQQKVKIVGDFNGTTGSNVYPTVFLKNCSLEELSPSVIPRARADDVAREFAKDREAAESKYKNKPLIISGKVEDVIAEGQRSWLQLKGMSDLVVTISKSGKAGVFDGQKKGQEVQIRAQRISPTGALAGMDFPTVGRYRAIEFTGFVIQGK